MGTLRVVLLIHSTRESGRELRQRFALAEEEAIRTGKVVASFNILEHRRQLELLAITRKFVDEVVFEDSKEQDRDIKHLVELAKKHGYSTETKNV